MGIGDWGALVHVQMMRMMRVEDPIISSSLPHFQEVLMLNELGRWLIILGVGLLVMGLLLTVAGRIPGLGRLPGDIVIQRENFTFYMPLGTMIVVSLVLTVLINLIGRFFR
jgi:hypothetical protein